MQTRRVDVIKAYQSFIELPVVVDEYDRAVSDGIID